MVLERINNLIEECRCNPFAAPAGPNRCART
nr:hypothetical protein [Sphingomonas xinjiangensis]